MGKLRRRVVLIGSLGLLGGLLFLPARIYWEMYRLRQMCSALRPGTPVTERFSTIKTYGFDHPLVEYQGQGSFDARSGTWDIGVPAPSTLGDMECDIRHDGHTVVASRILGP